MVQLSATRCSCIATSSVSLVSFTAITLCVTSQRVFVVVVVVVVVVVYFVMTLSGNFWIHPRRRTVCSTSTSSHNFAKFLLSGPFLT
jgi:hypothetical protein